MSASPDGHPPSHIRRETTVPMRSMKSRSWTSPPHVEQHGAHPPEVDLKRKHSGDPSVDEKPQYRTEKRERVGEVEVGTDDDEVSGRECGESRSAEYVLTLYTRSRPSSWISSRPGMNAMASQEFFGDFCGFLAPVRTNFGVWRGLAPVRPNVFHRVSNTRVRTLLPVIPTDLPTCIQGTFVPPCPCQPRPQERAITVAGRKVASISVNASVQANPPTSSL